MAFYSGPRRPTGNPGRGREYIFNRGSNRWEVIDSATGRTIGPVNQQGQLLDGQGNVRRQTAPAPNRGPVVDENLNVRVPTAPAPAPEPAAVAPAPQQTVTQPVAAPELAVEEPAVEEPAEEPDRPIRPGVPAREPENRAPVQAEPAPVEEPAAVAEPAPEGPTEEQQSARDIIAQTLAMYDLTSLDQFVYDIVFGENIVNTDIIMGRIRGTDEYKLRFAGNEERRRRGLNAISEEQYLADEDAYRKLFRNAGLPESMFMDKSVTDTLIGGDVSPEEAGYRISNAYEAVTRADPEVIQEMRRLYNIDDAALAAYFLDPVRGREVVLQQAQAANIAGQARQEGFTIGVGTAEELARRGVTSQQAETGFQAIGQGQELFRSNIEEQMLGEQEFGLEEQIGAVFGSNAAAAQRLRQRARRRQAQFEAGGRFATQDGEIVGLR